MNFQSLPAFINARLHWRAIYALLAFVLIPQYQQKTNAAYDFICDSWSYNWFSAQYLNTADFVICKMLAKSTQKGFAVNEEVFVHEPNTKAASNICANRAIKK